MALFEKKCPWIVSCSPQRVPRHDSTSGTLRAKYLKLTLRDNTHENLTDVISIFVPSCSKRLDLKDAFRICRAANSHLHCLYITTRRFGVLWCFKKTSLLPVLKSDCFFWFLTVFRACLWYIRIMKQQILRCINVHGDFVQRKCEKTKFLQNVKLPKMLFFRECGERRKRLYMGVSIYCGSWSAPEGNPNARSTACVKAVKRFSVLLWTACVHCFSVKMLQNVLHRQHFWWKVPSCSPQGKIMKPFCQVL